MEIVLAARDFPRARSFTTRTAGVRRTNQLPGRTRAQSTHSRRPRPPWTRRPLPRLSPRAHLRDTSGETRFARIRECSWCSSPLSGVAATSTYNAWAVGSFDYALNGHLAQPRTLIEHWNGKAWKIQASPTPRPKNSELASVAATSTHNAWAVGSDKRGPLIEHWDGTAWKIQANPKLRSSQLSGVAATSSRNAWGVGSYFDRAGNAQTLIEHWNGRAWKIQSSPDAGGPGSGLPNELLGVAAVSSRNAWAVGAYFDQYGGNEQTLIDHWNGTVWKIHGSPDLPIGSQLSGVAATSSTNVLAVGSIGLVQHTLALRCG
jgi:hypothetical protein